jgi:hypothetical protein
MFVENLEGKYFTKYLWQCEEQDVTRALCIAALRNLQRPAKFLYV